VKSVTIPYKGECRLDEKEMGTITVVTKLYVFLTEYFATRATRAVVAGERIGESLSLSVDQ
jgi:hypothetical protein